MSLACALIGELKNTFGITNSFAFMYQKSMLEIKEIEIHSNYTAENQKKTRFFYPFTLFSIFIWIRYDTNKRGNSKDGTYDKSRNLV